MNKVQSASEDGVEVQFAFESVTDDDMAIVRTDAEQHENSRLFRIVHNLGINLLPEDFQKTRIVITADFVGSVTSRQDKSASPYTTDRGTGVVVGKTMPPNQDGVVDIIFPLHILYSNITLDTNRQIEHLARHEAAHARLQHLGTKPFDTCQREDFGYAMENFIAMAGDQLEEHLVERIAITTSSSRNWSDAKTIDGALTVLTDAWTTDLLTIPKDTRDYHYQAMKASFKPLGVLWKQLAFLAAELRIDNSFQTLPHDISQLLAWNRYVAPWWDQYLQLLEKIPLSLEIDIAKTDKVVKELAVHLQYWAKKIGFDFHDTPSGEGWFQQVPPSWYKDQS